jgi:hypothetical protein
MLLASCAAPAENRQRSVFEIERVEFLSNSEVGIQASSTSALYPAPNTNEVLVVFGHTPSDMWQDGEQVPVDADGKVRFTWDFPVPIEPGVYEILMEVYVTPDGDVAQQSIRLDMSEKQLVSSGD